MENLLSIIILIVLISIVSKDFAKGVITLASMIFDLLKPVFTLLFYFLLGLGLLVIVVELFELIF